MQAAEKINDSRPDPLRLSAHTDTQVNVSGAPADRKGRYWDAVLASYSQYSQINLSALRSGHTSTANIWTLFRPAQETLTYDEEGNLTDDSVWHYTWDAENRLVSMIATGTATTWSPQLNRSLYFKYDYLGRRVEKKVQDSTGTTTRRYIYDGWNLIAEFELVGGVAKIRRSFVWGLDVAGSLTATGGVGALTLETVHTDSTLTSYHVVSDGQGSVTALVTALGSASGQLAAVYEYDPFGQPLRTDVRDSAVTDNPFRYSSKFQDRETGFLYYGHRYYDPALGRFINRDPSEEEGGLNLYGFVQNNPINDFDRLGLNGFTDFIKRLFGGDEKIPPPEAKDEPVMMEEFGVEESFLPDDLSLSGMASSHYLLNDWASDPSRFMSSLARHSAMLNFEAVLPPFVPETEIERLRRIDPPFRSGEADMLGDALFGWGIGKAFGFAGALLGKTKVGLWVAGVGERIGEKFALKAAESETAILQGHLRNAVARFEAEGFTPGQLRAMAKNPNNPGLAAANRGTQIDKFFKEAVSADSRIGHLELTPRAKFGPDVFNPVNQKWWDVTTPEKWDMHVQKYWLFGDGTPLFTR